VLFDNPNPYRKPLPEILSLAWGDFRCQLTPTNETALENEAEWGIVAYIGADVEDLPEFLFANLLEMKNAGSSADVQVCAFFMGPLLTDTFFARLNSSTSLDQDIVIRYNKRHANDVQTLVHALQLGASFPAKKRVVVISGHGRGWKGLLKDEDIATEKYIRSGRLKLPGDGAACDAQLQACQTEVQNRMNAKRTQMAADGPPRRYDVMALDACEMGALETVAILSGHADVVVASQNVVPPQGYPYDAVLAQLHRNPQQSPLEFATYLVGETKRFYAEAGSRRRITQIAIDSDKLLTFVDMLIDVVDAMGTMDTKEEIESLGAAIAKAQYYTDTGSIDLKAFLLGLAEDYPRPAVRGAAKAALEGWDAMIVASAAGEPFDTNGLSIYAPPAEQFDPMYVNVSRMLPGRLWKWTRLLAAYYMQCVGPDSPNYPLYEIIRKSEDGASLHILSNG
jgi:hypothetical protein